MMFFQPSAVHLSSQAIGQICRQIPGTINMPACTCVHGVLANEHQGSPPLRGLELSSKALDCTHIFLISKALRGPVLGHSEPTQNETLDNVPCPQLTSQKLAWLSFISSNEMKPKAPSCISRITVIQAPGTITMKPNKIRGSDGGPRSLIPPKSAILM